MNAAALALFAAVVWPLLVAAALAVPSLRRAAARLAPWAALPALTVAVLAVATQADEMFALQWLLLGSSIGLDATGRMFLLFCAFIWLLAGLTVPPLVAQQGRQRFWLFFLCSMAGNLGLILARDLATFYTLFTLMSFASYGLVRHERGPRALRAAKVYIALVIFGELLLIAGLVMATHAAQSLSLADIRSALPHAAWRDTILAALLIAFGVKAGLLLVHLSLPLIYSAAPLPAATALAGAMLNAGLLGWLRFLPAGAVALPDWGAVLTGLGLAAACYGVVIGILQRDPRALLAYSSISQVGLMLVAIGAGLALPGAWPQLLAAVTFFALHHALAKGSLFLGLAIAEARLRRWVLVGLALPSLALAGAPFTSGMPAKAALKEQLAHSQSGFIELAYTLLPWTSVATALLMIRFLVLAAAAPARATGTRLGLVWLVSLAASLALPWLLLPAESVLKWDPLWSLTTLAGETWPLLLAAVLAGLAAAYMHRSGRRAPAVPPGDVLLPLAAISRLLLAGAGVGASAIAAWHVSAGQGMRALQVAVRVHGGRFLDSTEARLRRWRVAMTLVVVLALLIAAVAGGGGSPE